MLIGLIIIALQAAILVYLNKLSNIVESTNADLREFYNAVIESNEDVPDDDQNFV